MVNKLPVGLKDTKRIQEFLIGWVTTLIQRTQSCLNWSPNNLTRISRNSVVEIVLVKNTW